MYNYRCKRCRCFNNSMNTDNNLAETPCNNVTNNNNDYDSNCSCGFDDDDDLFPTNPMYAQSYVPFQVMDQTLSPCSGLQKGTIFPELVSEYYPGLSMAEIQYISNTNTIREGCNG